METSRRDILKISLGAGVGAAAVALLPGCDTTQANRVGPRPEGLMRMDPGRYANQGLRTGAVASGGATTTVQPPPRAAAPPKPPAPPEDPGPTSWAGLDVQPRKAWTRVLGPISNNHNPMGAIRHITVHHEGWQVVGFTDRAETIERLEKIRGAHTRSKRDGGRNWSDVGYHFFIDRAGRIWEGRSLKLQGAHVSECNENNLGIMCLGNFEEQTPSQAQLEALFKAVRAFRAEFKVPVANIHSHQEWFRMGKTHSTECPGKNLQAHMGKLRKAVA